LASGPRQPKRSVLFVWHAGEERGLLGSRYFGEHTTVPRDSIVAQVNIDMIGRGATSTDTKGGGPGYVAVIGAGRLSTQLGRTVEEVNRASRAPLAFDFALDADGHPENLYCRSDHYNYARWGIPVVFFFTGLHGDYHQVTDEPQYINYPNYARVTRYVRDLTLRLAADGQRLAVDGEKLDPNGGCRQ
ncbi:MAG TPA: M28 family peptidase, partial [Gemmatimonadaceae bacterium]|nr:M28 family peptidase [Gemmatimonadaceae bacterium]